MTSATPPGWIARVGNWTASHRRAVLAGGAGRDRGDGRLELAGTHYGENPSLPRTDSQRAADLLARDFPAQAGDSDQIVRSLGTR